MNYTRYSVEPTMQIESRVAGIPCLIELVSAHVTKGNYSPRAETPDEYYGCKEIEFNVLDRRGRDAPWLANKLTDDDARRIECELLTELKELENEY